MAGGRASSETKSHRDCACRRHSSPDPSGADTQRPLACTQRPEANAVVLVVDLEPRYRKYFIQETDHHHSISTIPEFHIGHHTLRWFPAAPSIQDAPSLRRGPPCRPGPLVCVHNMFKSSPRLDRPGLDRRVLPTVFEPLDAAGPWRP